MKKSKHNFHGHTYLCGHALGTPVDYVKEAIKHNYTAMGISEHGPVPNLPGVNIRLKDEDYNLYLELMAEGKKLANEHGIEFYTGFEVEYFKDLDIYDKFLKDTDYLILGQHFFYRDGELKSTYNLNDLEDIKTYSNVLVEAINTGYFSLVCHVELCFYNIKKPTNEMYEALRPVIIAAKENNIPIELNGNGIRRAVYEDNCESFDCLRYPKIPFMKMVKEEGAKVLITSDCHSPELFYDKYIDKAYEYAQEFNLDLVHTIKTNKK